MTDTPLTDQSISQRTAYAGYGDDRVSMRETYVEVGDCRAIERELREEIAALRKALVSIREIIQCDCSVRERESGHKVDCFMPSILNDIDCALLNEES